MSEEINRYLWDGSGEVDAEVARFERALANYRFSPRPLVIEGASSLRARHGFLRWLVPVAATLAVCVLLIFAVGVWRLRWMPDSAWRVSSLSGAPAINGAAIGPRGEFGVGQVLETDARSSAEVRVAHIGVMRVEPGSRVELISTRSGKHRVALTRGTISAQLWAPPWSLEMWTPSAMAFDLGCKFSLSVMADGSGLLRVSSGWVQLESRDFQTLVPAGAVARTEEGYAPGSPYYEDATEEFKSALQDLNFGYPDQAHRYQALRTIFNEARPRDVVTLFNLMARTSGEERLMLYENAARLDPPPAGVTRDGIMMHDDEMLNRWWKTLGLGDVKRWWIHWEDAF